jgi:exonuclease III
MDIIRNYDGENVILGGDFNITLAERDSHGRQRTDAEKRIAENINEKIAITNLTDEFIGHNGYT